MRKIVLLIAIMALSACAENEPVPEYHWSTIELLKEYKVYDRAVQGVRREESTRRAARYKEPEVCRLYPQGEKARVYLPILEWTIEDVTRFIDEQGIRCAPVYYDADGQFHPERRLGCIGCPLASDNGIAGYKQYPKLLRQVCRAADDYLKAHPNTKAANYFRNGHELMFKRLFCTTMSEYQTLIGGGAIPGERNRCETVHGKLFRH